MYLIDYIAYGPKFPHKNGNPPKISQNLEKSRFTNKKPVVSLASSSAGFEKCLLALRQTVAWEPQNEQKHNLPHIAIQWTHLLNVHLLKPNSCSFTFAYHDQIHDQTHDQVHDQFHDQFHGTVHDQYYDHL